MSGHHTDKNMLSLELFSFVYHISFFKSLHYQLSPFPPHEDLEAGLSPNNLTATVSALQWWRGGGILHPQPASVL